MLVLNFSGTHIVSADDRIFDVKVSSKTSLLHLGSIDSFDRTPGGIKAAREMLQGLQSNDMGLISSALIAYDGLIPNENFGGEYTALKWFCEYLLAENSQRATMIEDPFTKSFFHFFADDNYATLKEYLERKYHLKQLGDEKTIYAHRREGFLEDFILFNNPRRESWEKSSSTIDVLGIKPGQVIADIGSGPGYYTFKFAKLTGSSGRVYAIDTNPYHNIFVRQYAKLNGIDNVEIPQAQYDNIGIAANTVDLAFSCSLYHIIYTTYSEAEKDNFVGSIRDSLKDDGRLVIVDNTPLEDDTLPYHGPYIDRRLIIGQMWHYGFRLVGMQQFIPQRYILVFEKRKPGDAEDAGIDTASQGIDSASANPEASAGGQVFQTGIDSKSSLVHIPNEGVPDVTQSGREAALAFYQGLKTKKPNKLREARSLFETLIPKERFGDEYTAFAWFCDYLLSPSPQRRAMLRNPLVRGYFDLLGGNDFRVLKTYLRSHYRLQKKKDGTVVLGKDQAREIGELDELVKKKADELGTDVKVTSALAMAFLDKSDLAETRSGEISDEKMFFWRDFILFNNPRRESWEQTSKIYKVLDLKPGQTIADVGSGPGYYSFEFSKMVGPKGKVFAVETNKLHLDYIDQMRKKWKVKNIKTVLSALNDTKLPENSIDHAFLCSLYSVIYATSMEKVKDGFVESIRKALKPNGRLIIVDNAVVKPPTLSYHGPYIDRNLIIAQLAYYGFNLVEQYQFIPQRYVLIFEKSPNI